MISKLRSWFKKPKYTGRYQFKVHFNEYPEDIDTNWEYGELSIELKGKYKNTWQHVTNCYRYRIEDKLDEYMIYTESKEFVIGNFNTIITVRVQSL